MFNRRKRKQQSDSDCVQYDEQGDSEFISKTFDVVATNDPGTSMEVLSQLMREYGITSFKKFLSRSDVLEAFEPDILWVMHLHNFIAFEDYLAIETSAKLTSYLRSTLVIAAAAAYESHELDLSASYPASICADVLSFIFHHSTMVIAPSSSHIATDLQEKCTRILDNSFLPEGDTVLQPDDVGVFCHILWIIAGGSSFPAVKACQIHQLTRLLSRRVSTSRNTMITTDTHAAQVDNGMDVGNSHSGCQHQHGMDWQCVYVHPLHALSLLEMSPAVYVTALDRLLRMQGPDSPFDHAVARRLRDDITPGVQSVLMLLLEGSSREGILTWRADLPLVITTDSIAAAAAAAAAARSGSSSSSSSSNGSSSSSRRHRSSNQSLADLKSILFVATATARVGNHHQFNSHHLCY